MAFVTNIEMQSVWVHTQPVFGACVLVKFIMQFGYAGHRKVIEASVVLGCVLSIAQSTLTSFQETSPHILSDQE